MSLKTKTNSKDYLTLNGVCDVMSESTEVKSEKLKSRLTGFEDINSQIEEFFKSGGQVKEINSEARSIPEWCWWQDNYPKNYRR
tara:strand:- start:390 stop:641 length:252 start_codon:yes stop_codon:yes gene_type:complete